MTEEENDMPDVLPDAHELVGSYADLEMSDDKEVKRHTEFDATVQQHSQTLDTLMRYISDPESFKLSSFSNADDRRTMIQVQATMLEQVGILRDSLNDVQQGGNIICAGKRQLIRNTAGHVRMAINTYMAMEVPEQDLSAPLLLPPIDCFNPVLPRDPRTYENRNMPRNDDAASAYYNNDNPLDTMYDPIGGLQFGLQ